MGANCDWKAAKWISLPGEERPGYTYFLARREFELEPHARSALLHISADLLYRLYVNGEFAGDGPPRNTTVRMSYRTYEVMSLLKSGRNAIAVEVYNQKEGNPHLRDVQGSRPGAELICQLELKGADGKLLLRLGTDENWRVLPGEAWDHRAWTAAGFSQSEIYDARKEPIGWRRPGFNDSGWHAPLLNASSARFQQLDATYRPHTLLEASIVRVCCPRPWSG
jgi:alpha-L-rhamnosidase